MRSIVGLALLALAGPVWAAQPVEHPAECRVAEPQIARTFGLPRVAHAIAANRLNVLVLGAGSSALPGPNGQRKAYPARLQDALSAALPGVAVSVVTDVKARRTAVDMALSLADDLARSKPDLLVWQTGIVDALQGYDTDQFSDALERGIKIARAAGADTVLINAQYSPRTESMIALGTYAELMRWVALQQEIPLFDRFAVMKIWADLGTFDFNSSTKKLDMAEHVHDCIGRLLADLIVISAEPNGPQADGGR